MIFVYHLLKRKVLDTGRTLTVLGIDNILTFISMLFDKHEDFRNVWNQNVTHSYKETAVEKRKLGKLIGVMSVSMVIFQTYAKIGP